MPLSYSSSGGVSPRPPATPTESSAVREARLERERALLEEGRAALRAGQGFDIDDPEVAAWLDGLDGEEDVPLPEPRLTRATRL